jgi:hypothetical protein
MVNVTKANFVDKATRLVAALPTAAFVMKK